MSEGKLLIGLTFQQSFIRDEQREQTDRGSQTTRSALTFCPFPPLPVFWRRGRQKAGWVRRYRGAGAARCQSALSRPERNPGAGCLNHWAEAEPRCQHGGAWIGLRRLKGPSCVAFLVSNKCPSVCGAHVWAHIGVRLPCWKKKRENNNPPSGMWSCTKAW